MEYISSSMIKDVLKFRDWPNNSNTPNHLLQLLDSMNSNDLKRFLLFVTEQETIPISGFTTPHQHITIVCFPDSQALPRSHVCFFQLDLPDYNNYQKLKEVCTIFFFSPYFLIETFFGNSQC